MACSSDQVDGGNDEISDDQESQVYHEIEMRLTDELIEEAITPPEFIPPIEQVADLSELTPDELEVALEDMFIEGIDSSELVVDELSRLRDQNVNFWHDGQQKIESRLAMFALGGRLECEATCSIIGLEVEKDKAPADFILDDCYSDDWCLITEPAFPFQLDLMNDENHVQLYGFGEDIYSIARPEDNIYSVSFFKNEDETAFFSREIVPTYKKMSVEEAVVVLNSPAFTFYDVAEEGPLHRNIWYNGETLNEAHSIEGSSHLFSYEDKLGFVAENDGNDFIYFNGQQVSEDFEVIQTHEREMGPSSDLLNYPLEVYENGILVFVGQREGVYYVVEVDLDEYLE